MSIRREYNQRIRTSGIKSTEERRATAWTNTGSRSKWTLARKRKQLKTNRSTSLSICSPHHWKQMKLLLLKKISQKPRIKIKHFWKQHSTAETTRYLGWHISVSVRSNWNKQRSWINRMFHRPKRMMAADKTRMEWSTTISRTSRSITTVRRCKSCQRIKSGCKTGEQSTLGIKWASQSIKSE